MDAASTLTYQTVPVSKAADTERARSKLRVNTAATRPYSELLALSIASCWLLKRNMHCTGPKICGEEQQRGVVRWREELRQVGVSVTHL